MRVRVLALAILGMAFPVACRTSGVDILKSLPMPDDARPVWVVREYAQGSITRMIEPEVFDCYAAWLADRGWQRQRCAPALTQG